MLRKHHFYGIKLLRDLYALYFTICNNIINNNNDDDDDVDDYDNTWLGVLIPSEAFLVQIEWPCQLSSA